MLTDRAQALVTAAHTECAFAGGRVIESDHLLLSLLNDDASLIFVQTFAAAGVTLAASRAAATDRTTQSTAETSRAGHIPYSARVTAMLEAAQDYAERDGRTRADIQDLQMALLDIRHGPWLEILTRCGVRHPNTLVDDVERALLATP